MLFVALVTYFQSYLNIEFCVDYLECSKHKPNYSSLSQYIFCTYSKFSLSEYADLVVETTVMMTISYKNSEQINSEL